MGMVAEDVAKGLLRMLFGEVQAATHESIRVQRWLNQLDQAWQLERKLILPAAEESGRVAATFQWISVRSRDILGSICEADSTGGGFARPGLRQISCLGGEAVESTSK